MIIDITQKLLWLVLKPTVGLLFKFSVTGKENLENIDEPVIVAMNHKSALDAFLFGVNLKFNSILWPMRFMVETGKFHTPLLNFLKKIGFIRFFILIFGHFMVVRGVSFSENIKGPVGFLKKTKYGSVFIFIEGERVFNNGLGKPRRGVAALALLSNRKVVPATIKGSENLNLKNFFRREIFLNIGKPILVPDFGGKMDDKYEKETEFVMDKIKELYENLNNRI